MRNSSRARRALLHPRASELRVDGGKGASDFNASRLLRLRPSAEPPFGGGDRAQSERDRRRLELRVAPDPRSELRAQENLRSSESSTSGRVTP